jgi:hypothetical protein
MIEFKSALDPPKKWSLLELVPSIANINSAKASTWWQVWIFDGIRT